MSSFYIEIYLGRVSTHNRVTQKPYIMVRAWIKKILSSVDHIARNHNKLVFRFSLILRLHAWDFLLAKYCEALSKIRSVGMFSILTGGWSIQ